MPDYLFNNAAAYYTDISRPIFLPIMKLLTKPTNIIYKAAILLCLPFLIYLIVFRIKTKNKKNQEMYYLTIILLSTAAFHVVFSSVAQVIDRYAIEAFVPSCLGIIGAISYTIVVYKDTHKKPRKSISARRKNA